MICVYCCKCQTAEENTCYVLRTGVFFIWVNGKQMCKEQSSLAMYDSTAVTCFIYSFPTDKWYRRSPDGWGREDR